MSDHRRLLPLAACLVLLSGCRDTQVTSYRVPHEPDPEPVTATAASGGMAGTSVATAAGGTLAWAAPAHWQAREAGAMRKATYAIAGEAGAEADLSITAFPGDAGGELANINRWRGQLQLPPITAAEIATTTQHVDTNGLHLTVMDFTGSGGAADQRVLGAIVPAGGETWFFKLTGPAALLGREREAFLGFINSLRPASAPTAP